MTSVDKAAIGWSIAIVAIGVAIAGAGPGLSLDTGSPAMQDKTSGDPFAGMAKETMSQAEEREKAMESQISGDVEEKVTVTAPVVEDVPKMT